LLNIHSVTYLKSIKQSSRIGEAGNRWLPTTVSIRRTDWRATRKVLLGSQVGRAKVKYCPPNPTCLDRMTGNQNTLPTPLGSVVTIVAD